MYESYGNTVTAKVNDASLRRKIAKAIIPFDHHKKILAYADDEFLIHNTEIVREHGLDLALLFGIRTIGYQKKGDAPLTKKEIAKLVKILNKNQPYYEFGIVVPSLKELVDKFDQENDRVIVCKTREDGSFEFTNRFSWVELFEAISFFFLSKISVLSTAFYDDEYDCLHKEESKWAFEYGISTILEETTTRVLNDSGEEDTRGQSEIPCLYDDFGSSKENPGLNEKEIIAEKLIDLMTKEDPDFNDKNNIGVCFERLGCYKKALEYYQASETIVARANILNLYLNGKVPFDSSNYLRLCKRLLELNTFEGYLYLARYYSEDCSGEAKDYKRALEYVENGIKLCGNNPALVFTKAWILGKKDNPNKDHKKSLSLYRSILYYYTSERKPYYLTAINNYACCYMKGKGCRRDTNTALYWFIHGANLGSELCINNLIRFYEDKQNKKVASFWKNYKKQHVKEEI